jgi:hypothetical protein
MKFLSVIFVLFGVLFFLMGLFVEPMFPPFCMTILFFAIAILFWRNSVDYGSPNYHDDMGLMRDNKKTPSETFEENNKRLEQIRKLRNK